MNYRILVPVDGSVASLDAARFAGRSLVGKQGIDVTLLSIVDLPPALLEHGGAADSTAEHRIELGMDRARASWLEERRIEMEPSVFAPARRVLRESAGGTDAVEISTKVAGNIPEGNPVSAILAEIDEGGYDAVVLGRRHGDGNGGAGPDDVADEILAERPECAVWVMDGEETASEREEDTR